MIARIPVTDRLLLMKHPVVPEPESVAPGRHARWLLVALLLTVGCAALFVTWQTSTRRALERRDVRPPYQNTASAVGYVGDSACIRCHAEIAETYSRHPMGHSLAPIEIAAAPGAPGVKEPGRFELNGLVYSVEHRGGQVLHQEARQTAAGATLYKKEAEVKYAIGSGRQAFSYLIERDGFLFESPITWFAHDRGWGLSPGYETRVSRFDRPVLSECLFCHANRAERVSSANNQYQTPVFAQGHSIGCERCHGPGELHVLQPAASPGKDVTIVNPAHLEPSRRDAVCEQCHLIGPRRIARIDTRSEDFRPGLEFYQFWSMFVPSSTSGTNKFASQPEQMHDSRCYRASDGQLGCISCHDPHLMPPPDQKTAYFRDRCLACHSEKGCRLPVSVRASQRTPADDCIGCHMPRSSSSNNAHVATTNHRIPRSQQAETKRTSPADSSGRAYLALEHFHRAHLSDAQLAATERDRGIALCRTGTEAAAAKALPLLEAAVAARPDDLAALESQGEVLGRLRRPEDGLAAYKQALKSDPTRQTALEGAAHLAFKAGLHKESVELWKRAIAVNPWRTDYQADMALAAVEGRDWRTAADAAREALRLNPGLQSVRKLLVQSELHLGNRDAARKELDALLAFDPPDRDALIRRFSSVAAPR